MALSESFHAYGIHSMAPARRADSLPYGIFKVLGGGTISLTAEFEDLFGGSNKFAVASEAKTVTSEFTSTVKSMPDFLFELYLGASVSTTAASATGTISALANDNGTSVNDASTGIDDITLKASSEGDLKTGTYVIKAVSATTVDVYLYTDIDFSNGASLEYQTDDLKINASPLTIVASTATEIVGAGLEMNGGSGTIGMTDNDTATFTVAAPHGGISDITVGKSSSIFPEHKIHAVAAKRANGDILEIEMFKAVGAGFPIALEETVFSIPELTIKLLYDSAKDGIAKFRKIRGVNVS